MRSSSSSLEASNPGATSKYSYIARVPDNITAIILHSWFKYEDDRKADHTAEKTARVPE